MKKNRMSQKRGMAMITAITGLAIFGGIVLGWYWSRKNFQDFSLSEKEKKVMAQAAMSVSDVTKSKLLRYMQTQVEQFNPAQPRTITTISAQQIGYALKDGEEVQIQCIGQGSFRSTSSGASLAACTDSNSVYPKIFSISLTVRNADKSVVASLHQNAELSPTAFNDFAYLVTGSTSNQITFVGGTYEGMVGAFFDTVSPAKSIGFINPPGSPLNFNGILVSNISPDQYVRGMDLGLGQGRTAIDEVNLNKGALTLDRPQVDMDLNSFRTNPKYHVIDSPSASTTAMPNTVTVQLGGLNSDSCKIQIIEELPPECVPVPQETLQTLCPEYIGAQENMTNCLRELAASDGRLFRFNGSIIEVYEAKGWMPADPEYVAVKCPDTDIGESGQNGHAAEICLENYRDSTGSTAGFDEDGQIVGCGTENQIVKYPNSYPAAVSDDTVFVIRGQAVKFQPINDSGNAMTVCNNVTFVIEESSSVTLSSSILRTHSGGGSDFNSPNFAPPGNTANMAILAKQGDISFAANSRSLLNGQTLEQLKLADTPSTQKSMVVESSLLALTGAPLGIPDSLRDPLLTGTMGELEVNGMMMGKEQAITRTIQIFGQGIRVSGFASVNLIYNKGNLSNPPPILGEASSELPLQLTTTSLQLDFANIAEAMALMNRR